MNVSDVIIDWDQGEFLIRVTIPYGNDVELEIMEDAIDYLDKEHNDFEMATSFLIQVDDFIYLAENENIFVADYAKEYAIKATKASLEYNFNTLKEFVILYKKLLNSFKDYIVDGG